MYIAYILDWHNLSVKDYFQFEQYSFSEDIEFKNKSQISINRMPNITDDDFVLCKQGANVVFFGLCEDFSSSAESNYTINLCQKEGLFDREIFVDSEALISSTGIEDFIVKAIEDNWIDSDDELMDRDYMTAMATTHTPLDLKVDAENGVYNLRDFLSYAKEYHGIMVDFNINQNNELEVTVSKDSNGDIKLDALVTDIPNYDEVYDVDVLARLFVKWLNTTTSVTTTTAYYLKTDRTITTDKTDPDRAEGISKSIYIEADSVDEVVQKVADEFKSSSYEHKISFSLNAESKAYPIDDYYVGRTTSIRTKTGIKANSLITATTKTSESKFVSFVCGKLRVTLIEKLRGK